MTSIVFLLVRYYSLNAVTMLVLHQEKHQA